MDGECQKLPSSSFWSSGDWHRKLSLMRLHHIVFSPPHPPPNIGLLHFWCFAQKASWCSLSFLYILTPPPSYFWWLTLEKLLLFKEFLSPRTLKGSLSNENYCTVCMCVRQRCLSVRGIEEKEDVNYSRARITLNDSHWSLLEWFCSYNKEAVVNHRYMMRFW